MMGAIIFATINEANAGRILIESPRVGGGPKHSRVSGDRRGEERSIFFLIKKFFF